MSKDLIDAAEKACTVLETLYFEYQRKIGPYASQAHDAAMKLRAEIKRATPPSGDEKHG